jgi:hypothetical protein
MHVSESVNASGFDQDWGVFELGTAEIRSGECVVSKNAQPTAVDEPVAA